MFNYIKQISTRNQISYYISKLQNPIICEIGVHAGDNFKVLLTDNTLKAYGVDIWKNTENIGENDNLVSQENLDSMYLDLIKSYFKDSRVKFLREYSVVASEKFEDNYFDFIYIDADHTYEAVSKDLKAWYPKLKKGGVIGGHDYIDGDLTIKLGHVVRFGVVDAVNEFKKEYLIKDSNFHLTNEMYASYYILKE